MTLRELLWMAEGAGKNQWSHTASLMALIANANPYKKKSKVFRPDDFNPTVKNKSSDTIVVTKDNIADLKQLFTGSRTRRQASGLRPQSTEA